MHVNSQKVSRLVSPVSFLQEGVARFHFTPVEVGVHRVTVWRHRNSDLPELVTPDVMTYLVIAHETLVKCTKQKTNSMIGQLKQILWSEASFRNEVTAPHGASQHTSKPTSVITDFSDEYSTTFAMSQVTTRRPSVAPIVPEDLGAPSSNTMFNYCDLLKSNERV